jgi:predicted GIY-YIG superfamily endonuclease
VFLAGANNASGFDMEGTGQRFVYILRSERDPSRHYVGRTSNVRERLQWHNDGPPGQTIHHRPWRVLVTVEFAHGRTAAHFEKYLKSGSGRAFAKRHFAPAADHDPDRGSIP